MDSNNVNVVENVSRENPGFDSAPEYDDRSKKIPPPEFNGTDLPGKAEVGSAAEIERPTWDNQYQFLMSCIATSVGLGNVWRFPFIAYQNGGGAFLIPYIIVLILIGKPMYYLETALGQFSSSNCVKVWALSPAMKGTGYAQALSAFYVVSYYMSIVGLCLYYLIMSFQSVLPWSVCQPEWVDCVPSGEVANLSLIQNRPITSAELYFTAVTLPGADKGILFFITPQWTKLLELRVWYAATTQVFFSLSTCSGALIMFSSFNKFSQNVYRSLQKTVVFYNHLNNVSPCSRDSMIVTTLDTFTSLISGITIFGILGNLAFQMGEDDISTIIKSGGSSLAFVSYPDAIAQSPFVPQLFSSLFFLMMAVLGVGSGVALFSTVNTIFLDAFPKVPTIVTSAVMCSACFLVGLVYVTPGGQYILELVDHYGGTFMRLFAAIVEIIGLENMCLDIEYMLGLKTSVYWRFCWGIVTPLMMMTVFFYALVTSDQLKFGDYIYPDGAYLAGSFLQYFGIALVPLFMAVTFWKYRTSTFVETIKTSFKAKKTYGPSIPQKKAEWREFRSNAKYERNLIRKNWFHHVGLSLIGGYRRGRK
ncbi:hypothetical protein HF086_004085 [Spodoptera exigua]|uniref:Transporter n=1 Tax=Spodoptera exigua TaxID=7107 RepID=A0A922MAY3_SPOEX|nr:hypothetical protein HF086_004085 [Spodoptera exigua]